MIKDIPIKKVEDIAIAILPKEGGSTEDELWDAYIVNMKDKPIKNILINTKGYGYREDEKVETGTFRYFIENAPAFSAVLIEPIQSELFDIAHEFFVTFTFDGYLFDKKYMFVAGSISEMNFTQIPILDRKGVMIK